MKIVNKFPPNYDTICQRFNIRGRQGVVFTYGDTLYVPSGGNVPPDLMAHEETHFYQQTNYPGGPAAWWERYLSDNKFLLDQELEAYRVQYRYCLEHMGRPERRAALKFYADSLSGPIYGRLISFDRAKELIQWNNQK